MGIATLWAAFAGAMWAIGEFGKRYGVDVGNRDQKATAAVCTYMLYSLGSFVTPLILLLALGAENRRTVLGDSQWHRRLLLIIGAGVMNGLGGNLATYAMGLASRNSSALIAMVENGFSTCLTGLWVMFVFREKPRVEHWIGMGLIVFSIVLIEATREKEQERTEEGKDALNNLEAPIPENAHVSQKYDSMKDSGKDNNPSKISHVRPSNVLKPSPAMLVAMFAALFWSVGPLGLKYGTSNYLDEHGARSTITFFFYNIGSQIVPIILFVPGILSGRLQLSMFLGGDWLYRAFAVFMCGTISGFGGVVATHAFAVGRAGSGAVIAVIESGVCTALAAALIMAAYRERPSRWMFLSGVLIIVAVVLSNA